jgi:hypothetical protein
LKANILDAQVLTYGQLQPSLSHFVTSLLHSTSVCNAFDRELSENKEGGETGGPGSFESRGKICFERKVISKDDWTMQSLWGERGSKVKRLQLIFASIPTLL